LLNSWLFVIKMPFWHYHINSILPGDGIYTTFMLKWAWWRNKRLFNHFLF